jgi:cold shock CspA family protein
MTSTQQQGATRVNGTMLWFNEDKGVGFIQSEDDERLHVSTSGFAGGAPTGRCAGRPVSFEVRVEDGEKHAVAVSFDEAGDVRRARPRHSS